MREGWGLIIIIAFSLFREGGIHNFEKLLLLAFTLSREGEGNIIIMAFAKFWEGRVDTNINNNCSSSS